jgi:hypothetical protein
MSSFDLSIHVEELCSDWAELQAAIVETMERWETVRTKIDEVMEGDC